MKEVSKSLLRRERERRGWSRNYVAEKTESDPHTVGRWERGDKSPNPYHLQLLCKLFDMRPHELGLLRDDEVDNQTISPSLSTENHEQQTEITPLSSSPEPQAAPSIRSETPDPSAEYALPSASSEPQPENITSPPLDTTPPIHNETAIFSPEFVAGSMHPVTTSVYALPKRHSLLWRVILEGIGIVIVASFIFGFLRFYPTLLRRYKGTQSSTVVCQEPPAISSKSSPGNSIPAYLTESNIGYMSFVSSGKFAMNSNQGMDDEMQIVLHHVLVPEPDKIYYVWLAGDTMQSETSWKRIGALTLSNGNASLFYPGDQQHTNLLATYSHLLITEEDTQSLPLQPTYDSSNWKYHAAISQVPNPKDITHYSLLNHLRHLLAVDPEIQKMGLQGGLDYWLFWNMQEIVTLTAFATKGFSIHNTRTTHNQLMCIMGYLDGQSYIHNDIPSGTNIQVNPSLAQIGLLYGAPQQQIPASLTHIENHINGVYSSPGVTTGQRELASLLQNKMNNLNQQLIQVHLDAKQLANMSNTQLSQQTTHTLLQNMETQVQDASNEANWIYMNIQYLATLNIQAY